MAIGEPTVATRRSVTPAPPAAGDPAAAVGPGRGAGGRRVVAGQVDHGQLEGGGAVVELEEGSGGSVVVVVGTVVEELDDAGGS